MPKEFFSQCLLNNFIQTTFKISDSYLVSANSLYAKGYIGMRGSPQILTAIK